MPTDVPASVRLVRRMPAKFSRGTKLSRGTICRAAASRQPSLIVSGPNRPLAGAISQPSPNRSERGQPPGDDADE